MDDKKNRKNLLSAFLMFFALIIVIAGIVACIALFVLPQNMKSENPDNELTEEVFPEVTQERLDSPDITIEEVVFFEKSYNETHSAESRDQKILDRIFALKHILLGALMTDVHDREGLVNICTIHAGEFSPQQQAVLDWYFGLSEEQQQQWAKCRKVTNLSEFMEAVKKQNKIK